MLHVCVSLLFVAAAIKKNSIFNPRSCAHCAEIFTDSSYVDRRYIFMTWLHWRNLTTNNLMIIRFYLLTDPDVAFK